MASTINPNVIETPTWVTAPPDTWSITIAPVPQNTNAKVPMSSAIPFFINRNYTIQNIKFF
jgi:hypothetical protein